MGYETRFKLGIMENIGKYKIEDIIRYMKKQHKKEDAYYPFKYDFEDLEYDEARSDFEFDLSDGWNWYNHETEMLDLSREFKDVVFVLYGEGHNNGDMWYKYFKNGKMQSCPAKITFDDYDESKLE